METQKEVNMKVPKKKMARSSIVSNVIFIIIMAILIGLTVFSDRDQNGVRVGPFSIFSVLSGSMVPEFHPGAVIITKDVPVEQLQVGDIITFFPVEQNNTLVTHRIVSVLDEDGKKSFVTRGDANNMDDTTPVAYESVVGKVIASAEKIGYALVFIAQPRGILVVVCVTIALLLLHYVFRLAREKEPVAEQQTNSDKS